MAWVHLRRSITVAQLIDGSSRRTSSAASNQRMRLLWSDFWKLDKFLSLHLGLPDCLKYNPGLPANPEQHLSSHDRYRATLAHVAEQLVSRNIVPASNQFDDDAMTERLEGELRAAGTLMPSSFWDDAPSDHETTPTEDVYNAMILRFGACHLRLLLHLPHALQSQHRGNSKTQLRQETYGGNRGYNTTRRSSSISAARDSARDALASYFILRGGEGGAGPKLVRTCHLLDFQAFTAGVVLLLLLPFLVSPEDVTDRTIVAQLVRMLHRVAATGRSKTVAAQGAALLETLMAHILDAAATGRRDKEQDEAPFRVVVPYFGALTIRRRRSSAESIPRDIAMVDMDVGISTVVPNPLPLYFQTEADLAYWSGRRRIGHRWSS